MKKKILSVMLSTVFAVSLAATSVFNTKVAKADGRTDILIGTKNLNNTTENSAKLGSYLKDPEKGWKRYDDSNKNIELYDYDGNLKMPISSVDRCYYQGGFSRILGPYSRQDKSYSMKFKFKGSKFRLINEIRPTNKMKIVIDGKEDNSNQFVGGIVAYSILTYEKIGMEYGEHEVEISVTENPTSPSNFISIDAIDIDETGELISPFELNKSSITLPVGASDQLSADLISKNLKIFNQQIVWHSSNREIAKVDSTGKVTALKEGKVIVTGAIGGSSYNTNIYAQCEVNVTNGQVATSISLDKKSLTLGNETSSKLTATVLPDNAVNKKVIWASSDESIVKVDQQGNVTTLKEGHAVVTAKIENTDIKDTCDVTVQHNLNNTAENSAKLGDILKEPEEGWKRYDDTHKFIECYKDNYLMDNTRFVRPDDYCYAGTSRPLHFSKDDNKVTMQFRFKGTKIRIINSNFCCYAGTKMQVTIDGKDESSNQYVNNTSEKEYRLYGILSFEKNNLKDDEHIVKIEVDPNTKSGFIQVDAIDIDGELLAPMQMNKSSISLPVNGSQPLSVSVFTEDIVTPKKEWYIDWRSSDSNIVKVENTGKTTTTITGKKEGKAIITASLYSSSWTNRGSNIVVQCEVNVTNEQVVEANSITLDQTNAWIGNNCSLNLKATVSPSNAINKKVVWTSSNENIATVDQEGNVKSVGYGQVVITAKIENTDIKATCDVEVSEI